MEDTATNVAVFLTPVSHETLSSTTSSIKSLLRTRRSSITSPKALRAFKNALDREKKSAEDDESGLRQKMDVCIIPWCNCSIFLGRQDTCQSCGHERSLHASLRENDQENVSSNSDETSSCSSCEGDLDDDENDDWELPKTSKDADNANGIKFNVNWHFLWHLQGQNQQKLIDTILQIQRNFRCWRWQRLLRRVKGMPQISESSSEIYLVAYRCSTSEYRRKCSPSSSGVYASTSWV